MKRASVWIVFLILLGALAYGLNDSRKRDGASPQTAVSGTDASKGAGVEDWPHHGVDAAIIWWSPRLDDCYLSLRSAANQSMSFVSVPKNWCEGMR